MATKNWKGTGTTSRPSSGNWNKSSNWSQSGVPGAGDNVVLGGTSTYTLTLNISATPGLNSLAINDPSATLAIGSDTLNVTGTSSTVNVTAGHITIAGGKINDAAMTLASGSSLSGWGTVTGTLSGAGTVTASGGTLDLKNPVDLGAASAFQIANVAGSDLQFDSSVGATGVNPTITFDGATGVLDIGSNIASFHGVIANFAPGDDIKVAGATSVQLDSTGKVLTVIGSSGQGTLTFASSYTGDTFSVVNGNITVSVPPPPVAVSNVINGPTDSNNASFNGFNAIPPDNALAVSANDVLMAENDVIEITNRSGGVLLSPESLSTFFASVDSGYSLTDPRALFDPVTNKFIVTCDALTTTPSGAVTGSAVLYAISNSADPTGGWTFGNVNTTYVINGQVTWADQPTIAWDGTYLDVTSAQFGVSSGLYVDNAVTFIPLSGGASIAYSLGNAADYRPVAVPGEEYFIGYTGNALSILSDSNASNTFSSASISLGSIDVGNGAYTAAQRGSSVLLDAGDGAVANAVYANGYVYAVFEVMPPGSTQPAVHWVQVDASNNALVAQGNITGPGGAAAFNPSIAVDSNGDVLVNFTASSSSMYPGAFAAVMPAGSSSFLAPVQYGSSVAPETATFGVTHNVIRWGDYSTAVADPSAPNGFVVSNEIVPSAQSFSNNAPWSTVTADITLSGGSSAAVVTASSTTSPNSPSTAGAAVTLSPLTAATDTKNHWIGGPATVASLDAGNLPAFGSISGGGSSGFDRDPQSSASLGLFVNYMASAFADTGVGEMPLVGSTSVTTHPQSLTTSHG